MASLKDKTITNVIWSFGQQFGGKAIAILTSIILARLLTPKAFGLIGMLAVFISVSQGLIDGGFNKALIQKKGADDEDYSSVFYINLVVSILLYFLLFFTAPLIAAFYDQPQLVPLTRVLALVFVITSFSYVQTARLQKEMRFKTLMLIHLPSIVISAVVAIGMAYSGFGVWSLVAQQIVMRLAYSVQIWIYAKWKPLWSFNAKKAKGLFSFGSRLMIATIFNNIYSNAYNIVIGKFFPIDILGYYKVSDNLTKTPTKTLTGAIKAVTFPVFSSIQDDNNRLKRGYKKSIQQTFFWICPLMILAAVMATPLFRLVLTEKWMPAVPYFRLLCVIGIVKPLCDFNLDVITVKGESGLYLKLNIAKKIIMTLGIAITVYFGIWALLSFQVIYQFIVYAINSYFAGRFINYKVKDQFADIVPSLLLSLLAGGLVYGFIVLTNTWSDFVQLIIGIVLGGSFYGGGAKMIKMDAYTDFIQIIKGKTKRLHKT